MIDDVFASAEDRMKKTVAAEQHELSSIRTGRASPALVEGLKVDYYGSPTPISQVASITASDARLLVITPWDRQVLGGIEKAIQKSDVGITPTNDGNVIRLAFPQLTQERRQELVKVVHKKVEDGKIALRNIRRDAHDEIRAMEKRKEISEDDEKRATDQLQKLVDRYIQQMEQVGKAKESELSEI